MKSYLIILIINLLFFSCYSCKDKKINVQKRYDVITEKKIVFPIDNPQNGKPQVDYLTGIASLFDYAVIDGIETLIIPIYKNRLAFYNIKTGKEYYSIKTQNDKEIQNFKYINKNKIIVYYVDDSYEYNDTTLLQILNYSGEAKICNFHLSTDKNINNILPFDWPKYELQATDKYLFIATNNEQEFIGGDEFNVIEHPIFLRYNINTGEILSSKTIKYPSIKKGCFYPNVYKPSVMYSIVNETTVALQFFYSPDIILWDYAKDKKTKKTIKSKLLDSIPALKNKYSHHNNLLGYYFDFKYDSINKNYYSFLMLNKAIFGEPTVTMIIADKDLNYLTEIINPQMGSTVKFLKNNIFSYYCNNDSIYIEYQKLIPTNKDLFPYLDSIKNVLNKKREQIEEKYNLYLNDKFPLLSYLSSKYANIKKDYVLLTIYENGGCPPCEESIKKLISQNNKVFAELPFYLILTGSKQAVIDGSYESFSNLKFIQDTLAVAQNLAYKEGKYSVLNPRLTVVRDNEIVLDTIYDAFHIESDLIPNLIENLGLKEKK